MTSKPNTRIIFFRVATSKQKIEKLCSVAMQCFNRKTPLVIKTASKEVSHFVDDMLWKYPPRSFLPHIIEHETTSEFVCITHKKHNPNQAHYCLNLTSHPLLSSEFTTIYELEDISSKEKQIASQNRFDLYRKEGFALASYT